jgi:hypothetical protein
MKTALLIKRVHVFPNDFSYYRLSLKMHAQMCQGLPCSAPYVILTVAAKCRHAWVKHCNTKFRINLFSVSGAVDGQEDESGASEGGDQAEHHSLYYTAKHFHIAPDTAAIRHPLPTHIYPPIDA